MTSVRAAKSKGWTVKDLDELKLGYGKIKTEKLAKKLNRSLSSIYTKANRIRLKIPKDYYEKFPCKSNDIGYVAGGYKRRSRKGKKIQEHILVWEAANGMVPEGFHIHHIDGNKLNNKLNNLQCLSPREHAIAHRKYDYDLIRKQYADEPYTMQELANMYQTSTSQICYIINGGKNGKVKN